MKRDKVMAMTDVELRIEVQELLGKDMRWITTWKDKERGLNEENVPDYPNEMSDAWELVELMKQSEWYPEIMNVGVRGELWCVYLDNVSGSIRDMYAQNENAERAITQAFILAMTNEGE